MPTPERAAQPRPTPSALSMRDLLASCAAATVISTPPNGEAGEPEAGDRGVIPPPARRDAA
ncbi:MULTISPECIES: hypothetical protein [Streptomyces]|uniref:hypothetical protein n=1 Tax=Streptomyces TaxID=1883 RepID=UPI00093AB073|nr:MULTISPECIES: hypothetical protein [unclassified Streptomyces]OKJ15313.1 hypothetical protein AMK20_06135 [Streptomyces sp. TSRI0261]QNQ34468.1 hypothetical protein HYC88_12645 [Streptomyces sp. CB00271]